MNFSSQGKQRDEQSVTRVYGSQQTSQTSIWQRTQKSDTISKLPLSLKYAAVFFLSSITGKQYQTCFLVSQWGWRMAPIFCPETASGESGLKACPLQQWPGYIVRGLVSVSHSSSNQWSELWWFKQQIYSFTVTEIVNSISQCQQGHAPEALRENWFLASPSFWWPPDIQT